MTTANNGTVIYDAKTKSGSWSYYTARQAQAAVREIMESRRDPEDWGQADASAGDHYDYWWQVGRRGGMRIVRERKPGNVTL